MNSSKIVLSILAGVAVGAVIGMLVAPDSGTSTRKKLKHKGQAYAEDASARFNRLMDKATRKFETLKLETAHMVDNGKAKAAEWKDKGKDALKS